MISEAPAPSSTNLALFREKVAAARRRSGHQQKELADALKINAQVLSRKLQEMRRSYNWYCS